MHQVSLGFPAVRPLFVTPRPPLLVLRPSLVVIRPLPSSAPSPLSRALSVSVTPSEFEEHRNLGAVERWLAVERINKLLGKALNCLLTA